MKQMKILPVLLLCGVLLVGLFSCGGRGSLDKAVRKVLEKRAVGGGMCDSRLMLLCNS